MTTFTGRNLYGAATRVEKLQCASVGYVEKQFWSATREALASRIDSDDSVKHATPVRRFVVSPHISASSPLKQPPYSSASRKKREQGVVGLRLYVLEDGSVADVKLEVSSGYSALDEGAVKIAKAEWKLIPGTINEHATAMWAIYSVTYNLYTKDIPRDQSAELKAQIQAYNEYLDQLERQAATNDSKKISSSITE